MFHKILRVAVVSAAAFLAMSANAVAQSTILVVDQSRVLRESEVGKHISRQLDTIAKSMDSEVKASTSPLKSERDRLIAELKSMDAEAIKSRPDLQTRANSLVEKQQKAQVDVAYKQRELQITEQKALVKVNEKLATILEAIVQERNADVVLDRSLVIYGKPADITDTVISRLNSQMRTVPVTRERLPRTQ